LGDSDEGSNSSSDEEGQPVESEGVLKRPSTQPPDPLATVRALSKAKEHFGVVEWEKMSTTDKTLALKQFIS
jgi:hypothetical protein